MVSLGLQLQHFVGPQARAQTLQKLRQRVTLRGVFQQQTGTHTLKHLGFQ